MSSRIKLSANSLKLYNKPEYEKLLAKKAAFPGWFYLREMNLLTDNKYTFDETKEDKVLLATIRGKFSESINSLIGSGFTDPNDKNKTTSIDIATLLKITDKTSGLITIQSSRGAIFEHWVRLSWQKLFKALPENKGKISFYFDMQNEGENAESRTVIDNAKNAKYKLKTRTIDCHYTNESNEIVLVELKHVQGKLAGDSEKQLIDNIALFRAKKIRRVEYIFSTKAGAAENVSRFSTILTNEPGSIKLFYIDKDPKIPLL